jgi:glucosamine-6-phosphate deaminase
MNDWRTKTAREVIGDTSVKIYQFNSEYQKIFAYAMEMLEVIQKNNNAGKNSAFIVPVGPSTQYPILADVINACGISLKNTYFYNMDEYTQSDGTFIAIDDPLSFRAAMNRLFYDRINGELVMDEDHRWFPTPGREEEMWKHMQSVGGIDICFGGIGVNGHVAFNEALYLDDSRSWEEFASLPSRLLRLTDETKAVNASYDCFGEMPRLPGYAMTIGMREILSAKKLVLYVGSNYHIRRALYGPICPQYPVSCIQLFKDAALYCSPGQLEPLLQAAHYAQSDGY